MPTIKQKADWCKKWITCDKTYAHKLFANAIVEGIFFSGSFASIFWVKSDHQSMLPGLRKSNRLLPAMNIHMFNWHIFCTDFYRIN